MTNEIIYSIQLDKKDGIHPGDIPAWKLAELLNVLSKQFSARGNDFCLVDMEDNCVRLDFKIKTSTVMNAVIGFSAFLSGHLADFESGFINNIHELDRIRSKFGDVSFTFSAIGKYEKITVPADKKLSEMVKHKANIRFEHTIYGKVIDAGGDRPNIHIRPLGGGSEIICDCSEELAIEVASLLYSVVGITGEVVRNEAPMRMKAHALLPYRKPECNPFSLLKEAGAGKYFENTSVEEFLRHVRGDDGEK